MREGWSMTKLGISHGMYGRYTIDSTQLPIPSSTRGSADISLYTADINIFSTGFLHDEGEKFNATDSCYILGISPFSMHLLILEMENIEKSIAGSIL